MCAAVLVLAPCIHSGSHARAGWTTSRHLTHATTDIPVQLLPEAGALWNSTLSARVCDTMAGLYGFDRDAVTPVDVFVVKYSHEVSSVQGLM
jgi:hypothetical protein